MCYIIYSKWVSKVWVICRNKNERAWKWIVRSARRTKKVSGWPLGAVYIYKRGLQGRMTSNNLPPKPLLNSALIMIPNIIYWNCFYLQNYPINSTQFIYGFQFILAIKIANNIIPILHMNMLTFPKMRLTSHESWNSDTSGDALC